MTATDPKAAERMHDALDLIASNLEDQVGRCRARVGSLVASVAADAAGLVERHKQDGADVVNSAFVGLHVRELVAAQAEIADRRERLRELNSVIEFAERAAAGKKART